MAGPERISSIGTSRSVGTWKWHAAHFSEAPDQVATEEPLEIRILRLDGSEPGFTRVSVTMRTPGQDVELVAGFLFTEGLVRSRDDLVSIEHALLTGDQAGNVVNAALADTVAFDPSQLQRNFYTTSSCGVCGKASLEALAVQGCVPPAALPGFIAGEMLGRLPEALRSAQFGFDQTGGLHAAGLFTATGELIALYEDVGRHNALDKLIGGQVLAGRVPLADLVLLVSGRTSFELLQKAAVAGVPVMAGVGAPSSLAVDTARAFGITLVGFLKERSFNVYSAPQRIQS